MIAELTEFEEAIREDVCRKCVCFEPSHEQAGVCIHETSGACPIFEHLPKVVEIVQSVKSPALSPYIDALREKVCCQCRHQDDAGFCRMRDGKEPVPSWCMLDSYISLVVASVERVLAQE